jgi:hypothetical protein
MDCERMAIFDCLYRRMGELTSHLGRYDMQLVAFAWMLTDEIVLQELIEKWPIDVRIDVITRLMRARRLPVTLQHQFLEIHQEMKPLLDRQIISPAHPAISTQIGFARPWDKVPRVGPGNDWFNRTEKVSQDEINRSVTSVERDILTSVRLYLSLATLSSRVETSLAELSANSMMA